jgi:hypothetical protein
VKLEHVEDWRTDQNFRRVEAELNGPRSFALPTGGAFTITDHAGAKVLEVRDDGTVHIRTGLTVTADL